MAVRAFTTDDHIDFSPGAAGALDGSDITIAMLWKPTLLDAGGLIVCSDGGTYRWAVNPYSNGEVWYTAGSAFGTIPWDGTEGWVLHVITNLAGGGNDGLRHHTYILSEATWSHGVALFNGVPATGAGAASFIRIGEAFNDRLEGSVACIGVWDNAFLDAGVEDLTDDFSVQGWMALDPVGLWALNQESVSESVPDLTGGGADQTSIAGTSVVTGDDPPGFGFSAVDLTIAGDRLRQRAQTVHFEVVKRGSWGQLRQVLDERAQLVDEELARGPVACPNDGEPLRTGPGGVLFCPFDGWRASA